MTNQEIQAVRERIRWTEKGAYSDYQVSSYYRQDIPKLLDEIDWQKKSGGLSVELAQSGA